MHFLLQNLESGLKLLYLKSKHLNTGYNGPFVFRLKNMEKLAESLEASSGGKVAKDTRPMLAQLNQEWSRLDKLWSSRNRRLEQALELQKWNKEADRIDSTIAGHEARLKVKDLGVRKSVIVRGNI